MKIDEDECGEIDDVNDWQRKLKYTEKTCLSTALSSTNST
jgi:hypothetical protein